MKIEPTGQILGATVTGLNLAKPISSAKFAAIIRALGQYGVLRFPDQRLEPAQLRDLSARFGELQLTNSNSAFEPGMREVSILSNVVENGRLIGVPDAGQDWHTDMTYNKVVGFVNVLVALKVPVRDGRKLGATEFVNTQSACADLPDEVTARLEHATATHDLDFYWEHMRRDKGSSRPPLTEEQRRAKPPVSHPVLLTHPITGRKVIYVNPGFVTRINGMEPAESAKMLDYLFAQILQPKYRYVHHWDVGDVLIWDHLGTWHNARADYGPDEHRLLKRCQVMATKIFDPEFQRSIGHSAASG